MVQRDRNGRLRKVYQPRSNPYRRWSNRRFVRLYRLNKKTVRKIARDFGPHSRTKGTIAGGGLSHIEQVCLALRYLATGASFNVIGQSQCVSDATVSRCVEDVVQYFYHHAASYIHWPHTLEAKIAKAQRFHHLHKQKPLVFGAIDGTHVAIISPSKNGFEGAHPPEGVFMNRKGFHSINAMVVCDADQLITHIDASFAGSANDQYSFATSPLFDEAEDENGGWDGFFLLGDSGYTLKDYLVTPYDRPVGPRQRAFNRWHRSTRCLVERTIGVMKQRWRCLDASGGYIYLNPVKACQVITTCACLHNLAIKDRVAHRDGEDRGRDRFRPVQEAPRGPRDHNNDEVDPEAVDHRDNYVAAHFRGERQQQQLEDNAGNVSDSDLPTEESDSD